MYSLYNQKEAEDYIKRYKNLPEELALRIYTSHLIGRDTSLVLHGGGNTSVKIKMKNIFGEERKVLFIKGSGCDLATIGPQGFPGLELEGLYKLSGLDNLDDETMVNQLRRHMIKTDAPLPSVETLVHAFLPHRYIDHTHADSILVLTNQEDGKEKIQQALKGKIAILPFIMPGFLLAKAVKEVYQKNPHIEAIVLLNHGIFTFGDSARQSYERMIYYVNCAREYIKERIGKRSVISCPSKIERLPFHFSARVIQILRGALTYKDEKEKLRRFIFKIDDSEEMVKVSLSNQVKMLSTTGVLTPDHIIRTKNYPLLLPSFSLDAGDDTLKEIIIDAVKKYTQEYDGYFARNAGKKGYSLQKLDPYPRVFIIPGLGVLACGYTSKAAEIALDIAKHTVKAKIEAEGIGKYKSLGEEILFDMEYWILEQRKLGKGRLLPLQGQIVFISGGAGAMALGIAKCVIEAGAVVVLGDIDRQGLEKMKRKLIEKYGEGCVDTIEMDVTDIRSVEDGYARITNRWGGIDVVVGNAGIAVVGRIEELSCQDFQKVVKVNLEGIFNTIKASIPVFKRQGIGGNIIVNSSKNVFAPSPAFGAYSCSKAGAHQISKIAAMELAELGVRVNLINADAVFSEEDVPSKLWQAVGEQRMKARGLSLVQMKEYYRQRNLLKKEVTAEDVGRAVVFFASEQTPTTGATLPIDGGIPQAFPR